MPCQCQGECRDCAEAAEAEGAELDSLATTEPAQVMSREDWEHKDSLEPDALPDTGDSRDFTPEPPARLDPRSILRNRRRVTEYRTTGRFTWPR